MTTTLKDIPGYEHTIGLNEEGTTVSIVARDRIVTRKIRHSPDHGNFIRYRNKSYTLA